jgi:hypothetical protein
MKASQQDAAADEHFNGRFRFYGDHLARHPAAHMVPYQLIRPLPLHRVR